MPPKPKNFVYDQHAGNISRKLQNFYQNQMFFDITLKTKNDDFTVRAHRNILSASSDYFLSILSSAFREANSEVIELGIDGATLKPVIDFMYTGTIALCYENVDDIFTAAGVLKMRALKAACSDFIRDSIDVTNWLITASLAKQQQSSQIYKTAFEFALQHFEEVRLDESFLQLTEEDLSDLVSSDDLCVDSEETVFHSLVSWVEYDKENREKCTTNLLAHVRFSLLKPEFIEENQHSIGESLESVRSWLESHQSGTQSSVQQSKRRKPNRSKGETLGFVSGALTDDLKLQIFDAELNIWSCEDLPAPPTKRAGYKAIVIDKKLIVAGGLLNECETNIIECLDLRTKEWSNLPPMREARRLPGMAEFNGDLYIVGGLSGGNWLCSVEKYDFRSREWQKLAATYLPLEYPELTVFDELLHAVGNGSSPIEFYNPTRNKWTLIPYKNEKSRHFGIAAVGDHLYAVGGRYRGRASRTVERYNPLTKTWTVMSAMLRLGLSELKCAPWINRLIACSLLGRQNSVEEYDPETNEWRTLGPLLAYDLNTYCSSLFTFTK